MPSQRLTAGIRPGFYRHRFGAVYDLARTGPILRRAGAIEKCGVCSDASFAVACLMSVLWVVAGYSLAFSGDGAWVGDLSNLFMGAVTVESVSGTIPESLFGAFQMTFAVITPALIIGAYVERIKFSAVLIFSSLWLLVVYAPVTHWVWVAALWPVGVLWILPAALWFMPQRERRHWLLLS